MIETLIGGALGGLLRLAPEVLKWLDQKGERAHELAMQDKALEFEKIRGSQRLDEIGAQAQADWNTGALSALKEAISSQAVKTGIAWVDGLSALVRPVITYWFMFLYCLVKVAAFYAAIDADVPWVQAVQLSWSESDQTLWAGILNFWFMGRVFEKVR